MADLSSVRRGGHDRQDRRGPVDGLRRTLPAPALPRPLDPDGLILVNQVERWFGLLTDKLIRRGARTSVQALENDIRDWIATWNESPRPFTWTKTADEILNSLADYLAKLQPGHAVSEQE